jgi:GTP-binding protein
MVLAVNKCESEKTGDLQAADFWQLGLGTPHPVSGIHGTGMGDLMDAVTAPLRRTVPDKATDGFYNDDAAREAARLAAARQEADGEPLRVAILGKPNVGKSSLLNRLTRTERAIVSDVAGTTRDVIDQVLRGWGVNVKEVGIKGWEGKAPSFRMWLAPRETSSTRCEGEGV